MTRPAQSSGHEWPVIHEELVRACIHAALPDSLLPQLRDAELSIMATRIAARINAEIYKQVASVAQAAQPECKCYMTNDFNNYAAVMTDCASEYKVTEDCPIHRNASPAQPECKCYKAKPEGGGWYNVSDCPFHRAAQPQEVPAEQPARQDTWTCPMCGTVNGYGSGGCLECRIAPAPQPASAAKPRLLGAQRHLETCAACNHGRTPCSEYKANYDEPMAAKPAEDGLEAHVKEVLALAWARFNEPLWKARADVGELLRTHQVAREREKLEGLAALWYEQSQNYPLTNEAIAAQCAVRLCAKELRALLASHWPAQKEDAK